MIVLFSLSILYHLKLSVNGLLSIVRRSKGVDTYDETTLVSFWKQPLCGVTQKGNNDETMRKQRGNKHSDDP